MSRSAEDWRRLYRDVSKTKTVLSGVDPDEDSWVAGVAAETIFVQRITFQIQTDAAVTVTFQDDESTPVIIAFAKASLGTGQFLLLDGGDEGIPLTEGADLDIVGSAAGYEGMIKMEGYRKPTGVRNLGTVGARQAIVGN